MNTKEIMSSLLSTEKWATFQEEQLQEWLDMEKEIGKPFVWKKKFSLQDLYKSQRDFIIDFTKKFNIALEWVTGQAELNAELESDLQEHRNAINTDMMNDFETPISEHDLLRKRMQYIKHFLEMPVKAIEKAEKEEAEHATPMGDEINTPAEDTTFTE